MQVDGEHAGKVVLLVVVRADLLPAVVPRDRRVAAQLAMLLSGGQDGGLFIMIGRKREGVSTPTRATATSRA